MSDTHTRVLVVEGESKLRRVIASMLYGAGMKTVYSVPDGKQAQEILMSKAVDFVLCDWSAPELPGMDILQKIRNTELHRFMPFLMMSRVGQLDEEDQLAAHDYDVDGMVFKPINQNELEDTIKSAVNNYNGNVEIFTHLTRASALADIGFHGEARAELAAAQEKKPDWSRVWTESGDVFTAMRAMPEAKQCYKKAIDTDSKYTRSFDKLALIMKMEGKEKEAIRFYEMASEISPRNKTRQYALAKAYFERGEVESAVKAVHTALEGDKDTSTRSAEAAEFFLAAGRPDLAETEFGVAPQADPQNVSHFNRLGIAFRRQKKYKEAVENYKKAITYSPNDAILYYNMAWALIATKEHSQAAVACRRAIRLEPEFKEAQDLLKKLQPAVKAATSDSAV
ncbi:MAG: tetratricopeptide repeat protein [bacterium]|nr:tetratricopeptide repeat protein [bacterium]